MSKTTIGVFLGSRRETAAICVAEEEERNPQEEAARQAVQQAHDAVTEVLESFRDPTAEELEERLLHLAECERRLDLEQEPERHFLIRLLERLPANSTYREIAERTRIILAGLEERNLGRPTISLDATGKGAPVVDLLREACGGAQIVPVYFNYGDRRTSEQGHVSLGKAYLVARLQQLLESSRLHLPRLPGTEDLKRDLLDFEIPVRTNANELYGAFRVGPQDDRVTALGLAVQIDPPRWGLT